MWCIWSKNDSSTTWKGRTVASSFFVYFQFIAERLQFMYAWISILYRLYFLYSDKANLVKYSNDLKYWRLHRSYKDKSRGKKIAAPTLFPRLVQALHQPFHLKTCQSAPPFVSRSFQCADSQVLTPCRPLRQLWSLCSIWPVLPPTRCSWETTLLTRPLGKSNVLSMLGASQLVFFPGLSL